MGGGGGVGYTRGFLEWGFGSTFMYRGDVGTVQEGFVGWKYRIEYS